MARHAAPTLRHRTKTVKQHTNRSTPKYGRNELDKIRSASAPKEQGGKRRAPGRTTGQWSDAETGSTRRTHGRTTGHSSEQPARHSSSSSSRGRSERAASSSQYGERRGPREGFRSRRKTGEGFEGQARSAQELSSGKGRRTASEFSSDRPARKFDGPARKFDGPARRRGDHKTDFSDDVRQRRRQQQAAFHSIDTRFDKAEASAGGDARPRRKTGNVIAKPEHRLERDASNSSRFADRSESRGRSERSPRETRDARGVETRRSAHGTRSSYTARSVEERQQEQPMEERHHVSRSLPKKRSRSGELVEQKDGLRLNKFLADAGIASRRGADELIEAGVVKVNGVTVREQGTRVHPTDLVTVKGEPVSYLKHLSYLVLNKPKDYITTTNDEKGRKTVMDLVPLKQRLYPVGRLDRNTTGTLLITNDGELATRLMHPSHEIEREYVVGLDKRLSSEHAKEIVQGVELEDGATGPAEIFINPSDKTELRIVLKEGRNREVRRIFEHFHYEVKRLHRVRYAMISVAGLSRGEYRHLSREEVRELRRLVGLDD